MIDIEIVRKDPDFVAKALHNRQMNPDMALDFKMLDTEWKNVKSELDALRARKNQTTAKIVEMKKAEKDPSEILNESKEISDSIERLEKREKEISEQRYNLWAIIPNIPDASVPIGKDSNDNVELKKSGKPKKKSTDVLPHYDLGIREGVLDFERGAKLGGHRFTVMSGWANKLERALINFMLDIHVSRGYREMWVPAIVKEEMMFGTGQLPKFREEFYTTEDEGNRLCLIPTAEVPLTNLHSGEILEESDLPKKYVAFTPCFRKEAGSYGKDIKGIIRQHQFDKVEMVKITAPETSSKEHDLMLNDAENILKLLDLPYKVITLCTGDMGFSASKTYDIEVWMPSQDKYREISSVSNCTDFQARRMKTKLRRKGEFVLPHTLNGSGLAVGRTLVAIMENFQEKDGLKIPKSLINYMGTDFVEFK
ncbi:MAG: serine--tRNA ligase [Candidatus Micrarchaeota archaeon]|nr:serine--tRNA ligase [Candidatus Micrarchaeota archaeon]